MPQNRVLQSIPRDACERLSRHMKTVDLSHGQVLQRPNEEIERVYFPFNCLISITVTMEDGSTSEAGIVGNERWSASMLSWVAAS
jgi:hypothetical protein